VKLGLRDKPISFLDSRIFIQQGHWKQSEMVTWYQSLDVFVSAVSAEGFGLHQLESMSCGKPIIATQYAGLKEFLNQENGYCLPYTEVPSTGYWATPGGRWSDFKDQDMIEAMRYCYQHRSEVQAKGRSAADTAKQFTLEKFIAELLLILNQ
jgi:glycosyltransferase involved in cell wall biosynthesis